MADDPSRACSGVGLHTVSKYHIALDFPYVCGLALLVLRQLVGLCRRSLPS